MAKAFNKVRCAPPIGTLRFWMCIRRITYANFGVILLAAFQKPSTKIFYKIDGKLREIRGKGGNETETFSLFFPRASETPKNRVYNSLVRRTALISRKQVCLAQAIARFTPTDWQLGACNLFIVPEICR